MNRHLVTALVCSLLLAGCGGTAGSVTEQSVTFMAGYSPQANLPFVGVYVAEAKGYFEEVGLDVAIEHSGGGGEHLQLLAAGEVDVTTQDAAVLLERRADPGLPLVSIALTGQVGQQAYVALADSGMETPADWVGQTVGFKGTPAPDMYGLMDEFGVGESQIDLVNVGFDPRVLTEGSVDVYPVFKSNEPDLLRRLGFDVTMWDPAAYGIPTLGLTFVATESAIAEEPEALRSFVTASMRGLLYAEQNRDEAIDIVLTHTGEEADPDHQRFILDTEFEDFRSDVTNDHQPGWQTTQQWQALADELLRYEVLTEPIDIDNAFTNELLD
ncbi:MAG: hypothetical protein GEU79_09400 [Acidimicrobiia bacterium]|nr:hypothetical protein [Acidimicrobiia bacterium]